MGNLKQVKVDKRLSKPKFNGNENFYTEDGKQPGYLSAGVYAGHLEELRYDEPQDKENVKIKHSNYRQR
jgi:hypothetical protein